MRMEWKSEIGSAVSLDLAVMVMVLERVTPSASSHTYSARTQPLNEGSLAKPEAPVEPLQSLVFKQLYTFLTLCHEHMHKICIELSITSS